MDRDQRAGRRAGRADLLTAFSISIFAFVFLAPTLTAGHVADDMFAANIGGYVGYHGITIWQFIEQYNLNLLHQVGRFFPGAVIIQSLTYYLSPSPLPVKIVQECAILINVATFAAFVYALTSSRNLAALTALASVTCFQLRFFYDPIISFVITLPVMFELVLLAAIGVIAFGRTGRRRLLAAALAAYALACVTYEISYAFLPILFILAWTEIKNRKVAAGTCFGFTAIVGALVVLDVVLRSALKVQMADEYVIAVSVPRVAQTFWWQVVNALPASYRFFDPHSLFEAYRTTFEQTSRRLAAAVAAIGLVALIAVLARRFDGLREALRGGWARAGALGILFWTVPAVMISISPRWQREVILGEPYLPIYFEVFGVALLLALVVYAVRAGAIRDASARALVLAICCCLFAAGTYTTFRSNAMVIALFNQGWKYPRQAIVAALQDGVLNGTPDGTTLYTSGPFTFSGASGFFWDTRYLVYLYSHRRVVTVPAVEQPAFISAACGTHPVCTAPPQLALFALRNSSSGGGEVIVAPIVATVGDGKSFRIRSATIWQRDPRFAADPRAAAAGDDTRSLGARAIETIDRRGDWAIRRMSWACPVDATVVDRHALAWLAYGTGFMGPESLDANRWNWSQRRSQLAVQNGTEGSLRVSVAFSVLTTAPGASRVRIVWPGGERTVDLHPTPTPVALTLDVPAMGSRIISFESNAGVVPKSAADPRDLHFQVLNDTVSTTSIGAGCS